MTLITGMRNHPLGSKSGKKKNHHLLCCAKHSWYPESPSVSNLQLGTITRDMHNRFYASVFSSRSSNLNETWGFVSSSSKLFFVEKVRDFFLQFYSGMGAISLAWSLGTRLCWIHWVYHHLSGIHDVLLFSTCNAKTSMAGFLFTRKEVFGCPKWTNFNQ